MIPYVDLPEFRLLGPHPVHAFGLLVIFAVLLGWALAKRRVRVLGLDQSLLDDTLLRGVAGGLVVAHLVSVLFYFPDAIRRDPWVLLKIWAGLSSIGGFVGGALCAWLYLRHRKASFLTYSEPILFGLMPAWIVGRLGCFLAHDHPGKHSEFVLAVAYPGGARHDLGLYEALLAVALTVVLYALHKRRPFAGFHLGVMLVIYAPVRFVFDFLRIDDARYLGLTPGQYFSVGLLGIGLLLLGRAARRRRALQATAV